MKREGTALETVAHPCLELNRFYPRADYFDKIFLSGKSGMDRGAGGQVKIHFKDLDSIRHGVTIR